MYKKNINYLKNRFPTVLSIYYKFRFIFRALYLKEPRAHLLWILKRGDSISHKKFNLNSDSIFFDVGGFEGDYTDKILNQYDCKAYIFEPHPEYFRKLQKRFINKKNVKLFNYGLGGKTENLFLTDDSESSKVTDTKTELKTLVRDITEVIEELAIEKIDLLKLNIEGMEYELLEKLIETGEINKIDKLKIQFHENVSNAARWREKIRNELKNTHKEIWTYYMVWERWDRLN
tara:strand:+ start:183 stop:878 length:696 start_codon:yes stop_codon:yes gene_type:complete